MRWHYSKTMPVGKMVKIGVWEDGTFIGCLLFSWGANQHIGRPYGPRVTQVAELVRVALNRHVAPVTRIVSVAIKMLRRQSPGLQLLVSYADTTEGHLGIIYQAGNWIYTGETKPETFYSINGKIMHRRAFTGQQFGRKRTALPQSASPVSSPGKHRYIYPLSEEIRNRIQPLSRPYPKRAGSIADDATANHAGEGGLIPTPALQLQASP